MKLPTFVLSLALMGCSVALAEEFTTLKGLRSLPPVAGLTSENSFDQAERDANSVLSELMADVMAMDREGATFLQEPSVIEQKRKDEQAKMDEASARFDANNKKYLEGYARYEEARVAFEAEQRRQSDELTVLYSVPSAQQDRATSERLQTWARDLAARKAVLDEQRNSLLAEHDAIEAEKAAAAKLHAAAEARLLASRDTLEARAAAHTLKKQALLEQLALCVDYVTRLRQARSTKFGKRVDTSPLLDGAIQRLEAVPGPSPART